MRILFTTDQVYLHGGIEKVLAEKANHFADVYGYDVYILTTEQKGNPPCYRLSEKVTLIDLAVNYERHKSYLSMANLKKILPHYTKLNKCIGKLNPNVIVSCNFAHDFYWLPFVYKRIPKFKEFHSSRFFTPKQRRHSSMLRRLKFTLDDFIESKFHTLLLLNPDELSFYASDNLQVIPNPIQPTEITATLVNKRAVAAGRIAPVKGFDSLIRSWALVAAKAPEWQLDIYGDDYLNTQAKLQDLIVELGLQNHVRFAGTTSNMAATMADYSLYVMSSQTECFPMVLLESLSVGLPIVSFDCPTGPRHIVTDGQDGFLVDHQNVEALSDKILLLCQDAALRTTFGVNAKRNSTRFNTAHVMQQWKRQFLAATS